MAPVRTETLYQAFCAPCKWTGFTRTQRFEAGNDDACHTEIYHQGVAPSMDLKPKFPKGTPEYAAYEAALKEELGKFSRGEAPYEYPTEEGYV